MSTPFHGFMLITAIEQIDAHILSSVDHGHVPMLDAVETAKLLRALVRGDETHSIDRDSLKRRFARSRAFGGGIATYALAIEWGPEAEEA